MSEEENADPRQPSTLADLTPFLLVLRLPADKIPTMKEAKVAYRALMVMHPDKAGAEATTAFQNITEAARAVFTFIERNAKHVKGHSVHSEEKKQEWQSPDRDIFKNPYPWEDPYFDDVIFVKPPVFGYSYSHRENIENIHKSEARSEKNINWSSEKNINWSMPDRISRLENGESRSRSKHKRPPAEPTSPPLFERKMCTCCLSFVLITALIVVYLYKEELWESF